MQEKDPVRTRLPQVTDDQGLLQAAQSEPSFQEEEQRQVHTKQTDRSLAGEIALACQRLQGLLPPMAGMPSPSWISHGYNQLKIWGCFTQDSYVAPSRGRAIAQ